MSNTKLMVKKDSQIMIQGEVIMSKIILIRRQKVMINNDLAELYGVTTKRLNEKVKRSIERFPGHFMFQFTENEKENVVAIRDHLQNEILPIFTLCFYMCVSHINSNIL